MHHRQERQHSHNPQLALEIQDLARVDLPKLGVICLSPPHESNTVCQLAAGNRTLSTSSDVLKPYAQMRPRRSRLFSSSGAPVNPASLANEKSQMGTIAGLAMPSWFTLSHSLLECHPTWLHTAPLGPHQLPPTTTDGIDGDGLR